LAADGVDNAPDGRALATRFFKRGQRIDGFTALRDREYGCRFVDDGVAVAKFAAVVNVNLYPRQLLEIELAYQTAEVAGSTGHNGDSTQAAGCCRVEI